MPAPSPACQSSSDTLHPCFSPYMRYIRASISAQSWLSVPPAPELICRIAGSSSSGSFSVLLNSASSIAFTAWSYAARTSSSAPSPSFQNSKSTAKSSTLPDTCSYRFTQYSFSLMSFNMDVARLLSSQKPGERESCLSFAIFCCLLATSKKPPQDGHTVPHIFNLFCCHAREDSKKKL